jgi:DNA-binding transcriptional MerR regulator
MRTAILMVRANVSRDTLRYYEREGVMTPPHRRTNGYRDYPESAIDEIRFIRLGQSVGLPLQVIRRAIPYLKSPVPGCPELRAVLEAQLESVLNQLQQLRAARERLRRWLRRNLAEARRGASRSGSSPRARRTTKAAR